LIDSIWITMAARIQLYFYAVKHNVSTYRNIFLSVISNVKMVLLDRMGSNLDYDIKLHEASN